MGASKQSIAVSLSLHFPDKVTLVHPPRNLLWDKVGVPSAHIFQEKRLV